MNITLLRKLAPALLAGALALLAPATAKATVYLSWSSCNNVAIPTISTDETGILSGPYRLRAKFIDGSMYGFHAATSFQNNNAKLNSLPPPGTYTVALYSITYTDYSYSTIDTIGAETDITVTVYPSFSFAMNTSAVLTNAYDPQGGLSSFSGLVSFGNGTFLGMTGAPNGGNYTWTCSQNVSTPGSGTVYLSAGSSHGSYTAPAFSYNGNGTGVYVP